MRNTGTTRRQLLAGGAGIAALAPFRALAQSIDSDEFLPLWPARPPGFAARASGPSWTRSHARLAGTTAG